MNSQLFKNPIPKQLLISLLENIALKNEDLYIINNSVYKKGLFNGLIPNFIQECKNYYHISKYKYLDKKISYKSFVTIVRQICNFNNISYKYEIKYDKSHYDIIYYINCNSLETCSTSV